MLNLFQLRKHPELPPLYSKAAGIKYTPPDQAEGCWVDQSKIKDLTKYLKSIGASDQKTAIILRLISGTEIFQDTLTLYRSKKGDCFPLSQKIYRPVEVIWTLRDSCIGRSEIRLSELRSALIQLLQV